MESMSTVLYNMTCKAENLTHMLQDAHYVNTMIRIMRKGINMYLNYELCKNNCISFKMK